MTVPDQPVVSEREAEVLAALSAGQSNAQIANRMHLSVRTVEGHVSSLLRKYGVADRQALVARADVAGTAALPGGIAGLPRSRTSLVGRQDDRDAVLAALADSRLVTLVGPGGVGKTRLAAVVAEAAVAGYRYGAAFVDLVPVRDGLLGQAVAAVLGVSEQAHQRTEQAVVDRLFRGPSLLILDNCEHLPDAVADFVEQILATCPTTVLATSRERLGLPGERICPVSPLPLGSDAEQLFRDRAALAHPDDPLDPATVTDLCARLDGLPLAIELAAARSASLGATGLLTGLSDYLRLLAGGRGSVVRHRSLRGVIGWSHDLLDHDEQAAFRRLSMFVGDFDLPAAAAVTGAEPASIADTLGRLVDKSLVTHHNGRWRLLETVRAFAAEQREADPEAADVRQRYLHWAAGTAADLASSLVGDWRAGFDIVANDLRAAMAGAPEHPDVRARQLARSLGRLTFVRGFLRESADWCERAAALALTPSEAAGDLGDAADCAQVMNDSSRAYDLHLAAADRARLAGDGNGLACALARAVEMSSRFSITFSTQIPFERRRELLAEAVAAGDPHDPVVAARLACAAAWTASPDMFAPDATLATAAVAAARAAGDPALLSACLDAARTVATNDGLVYESHQIASQRLELLSLLDPHRPEHAAEIDDSQGLACLAAVAAGDLPAARSAARLLTGDDLYGDNEYLTTSKIIPVLVLNGDLDKVVLLADAMWDSWQRAGRPPVFWMQIASHFVALAHGLRGDRDNAHTWRARVAGWTGTALPYQSRLAPLAAFVDARLAVHLGDLDRAADLVAHALRPVPQGRYVPFARAAAAELAVVAGLPRAADDLTSATPDAATNDWVAATVLRATGRLHDDVDLLAQSVDRWERMAARFEHAATLLLIPDRAAEGRARLDALGPVPPAG